jgi:hypothetical protein
LGQFVELRIEGAQRADQELVQFFLVVWNDLTPAFVVARIPVSRLSICDCVDTMPRTLLAYAQESDRWSGTPPENELIGTFLRSVRLELRLVSAAGPTDSQPVLHDSSMIAEYRTQQFCENSMASTRSMHVYHGLTTGMAPSLRGDASIHCWFVKPLVDRFSFVVLAKRCTGPYSRRRTR